MSKKQDQAVEIFNSGCNCAQSVLTAFEDILGMNREQLMSISAGFGGGMGKLQETCGAATGAYMLFSIYSSSRSKENQEAKNNSAIMIRDFTKRFVEIEGSSNCKKLIGVDLNTEKGMKKAVDENLFDIVCVKCVVTSVRIIEDMLHKQSHI